MTPLSDDLRRRLIEARQAGAGSVEVSERFRVSRRTVARLYGQFERSGELRPKQIGGYRRSRLEKHGRMIAHWISRKSDISVAELKERCLTDLGMTMGINALWHQLLRLGLSFKKMTRAAEQDRPDVAAARKLWRHEQPEWDCRRRVFIDETDLVHAGTTHQCTVGIQPTKIRTVTAQPRFAHPRTRYQKPPGPCPLPPNGGLPNPPRLLPRGWYFIL